MRVLENCELHHRDVHETVGHRSRQALRMSAVFQSFSPVLCIMATTMFRYKRVTFQCGLVLAAGPSSVRVMHVPGSKVCTA